ncbi:SpaA isopeptide-forming pilin-related protein [Finegoldia magna]|uniref:SpaA isopeptide-forming pilin-related protein n=1 Tax=Finegoldia magna TaxID=1260 RepID=UPI00290E00FF|nr:SpaA isopeptide-forming pilin-related protein [Finegoldia magna]MDU6880277.1 SpaA isopeptide-forming pilin-related protein [Finegoldia magna]
MRKILDRLTALVMVMLMVIQTITPAITSFAKEEELDKRYVIQKLETLKQDTYANFSLNLATVIDDKNLDTDTNVKFVLNTTNVNSNIKLLVRKDFSLYDERTFDTVEEAHKEFDRVDKSLKDQGLSLDVSVVQEDGKYRIHNNYVPQADKEDFGDDYKVYSLKVVPEFDFDKEGLFNKLPENLKSTEQHRLQLAEERRLQQDGEVPEGDKHNRTYIFDFKVDKAVDSKLTTIALNKDDNNPLEVKQNADLFAAILDDKTYSTYQTEQLPAEVTSSIEHKKEVAEAKAQADAKAKAEADAKAKAEAEEKAKKEAEEKAKADAKAKEEADAKAKQEADAKAKEEAEKIKAEEAKKTEEQKALEEKAKQEADAKAKAEADAKAKAEAEKLKAEAEAKQKAEAEAKAKQEQLAKKQAEAEAKRAAEEKAKKDLENKKLLGLEKDTEENQEEEPIIKKKETTEEVKKEPATPKERKQKAEEFDKALQDKKEDIKKSEDKKDANNKEDNKKTTDKKEVSKETKGLLEGIKEFFGFSNLQKADRELKAILAVDANGLKEVQALLSSFEAKYHLTKEEQAKLMDDNADAIKALIEKDADKNFNPQMFAVNAVGASSQSLADNKYTIITRFDVSTKAGAVQAGQTFTIKLDDRLTVKDVSTLKPIVYNGKTIADPSYDEKRNTITYTIAEPISQALQIPLSIDVDYNIDKIKELDGDATTHSIKNSITGVGVPKAVNLPETVVDNDGKVVNQIIEPGSNNVLEIVDQGEDYQVHMDVTGNPIVKDGELDSIDWTVRYSSTKDLLELGLISNATLVKGSGLSRYENITINGKPINQDDITKNQIEEKLGIRESKNHELKEHTKDVVINFQTPVFNKQQKYMIDFSVLLKNRKKSGAVRLLFDNGYTDDEVKEKTSKRIGMNNRTTIMGEFTREDTARWTVTDGVSTGDTNNGLPLATRELTGGQDLTSSRMAVYGIDESTGKMVIKTVNPGTDGGTNITGIPEKETNPSKSQVPGTIAVYEYDTNLTDSNAGYSMGGVNINKYQDVTIKQTWAGIDSTKKMPAQKLVVQDGNGKAISPEISVLEGQTGVTDREITIPAAKYWTINSDGKESKTNQKIVQTLPKDTTIGGKTYSYKEKYNYLSSEDGAYHIYNVMSQSTQEKDADFTVIKFDSKDPNKKLAGAKFTLQSANDTIELVTDANGRASFSNVSPGTYTLIENEAPNGYKLDTSAKRIKISDYGKVSVSGDNIAMQGGKIETKLDHHQYYPYYPSYMNALHYGKIDGNGNIEFYIYLKPEANGTDGSTNKNTRLNLNVLGGTINSVEVLDVGPGNRNTVKNNMYNQTAGSYTGTNLINAGVANDITGTKDVTDSFTGKTGYQLKFPSARFTNDWGFLVKVKATGSESTAVSYDWLTDTDRVKDESRIQESIGLSTSSESGVNLNIGNEPFQKLPVEVTKIKPDKSPLANATFRLRDSKNKIISDAKSGADGKASFGELSPGNYTIEEISAPSGYQKSQVIFDVHVGEDGKVIYNARFKDGAGTPKNGVDYILEEVEAGQEGGKATVTGITQTIKLQERQTQPNDGRLGWQEGIWEAYGIESYRYKADFSIANASKGGLFKIQFDPNLDFRRYVYEIPDLKDASGKVLAKPYFNYETNLLTYQFTDNIDNNAVNASLEIIGIIPDKYYATQTDKVNGYNFRIVVDPDDTTGTSNPTVTHPNPQTTQSTDKVLPVNIKTDYYAYDSSGGGGPLSSEYIYDIYKDKNGDTYLKAMTYYNPTGLSSGKRTLRFDWLSMNKPKPGLGNYVANGLPAFGFKELEVYKVTDTPANKERLMPLSYGIRPDQDPRNYNLVYKKTDVNPQQGFRDQVGDHRITYDPSLLKDTEGLLAYGHEKHPLEIDVPRVGNNDGYVIIQTFKVTDEQRFKNLWSAYYFSQGSRHTGSYQKGNANIAIGSETGQEIPKFYTERVKLFNKTYKPGQFQIEKLDEANRTKKLQGATFSLTDADGHVIYRSSDADGIVDFRDMEPGTYTLEETEAPKGYTKSTRKWSVTVYDTGNVLIREIGITGTGSVVEGTNIKLPVSNKPVGDKFQVYKKNGKGEALQGAEFTICAKDEKTVIAKGTSDVNGIVDFKFADGKSLEEGQQYILKETNAPQGYKPIDKKWVLEVKDGKTKVYNYLASADSTELKSFIAEDNVNWVDAKNRNTSGWSDYDNRWTGWTGNSKTAQYMGTRIIAINKTKKYAIQRYVINPEARKLDKTTASIHRQVPGDSNMTWYDGNAEYKVFELDKPVTGLISDLILTNYETKDITEDVKKTAKPEDGRYGEPKRLNLTLPATSNPIVIDVKVPYKEETGGVGTGMDWMVDNSNIYWKADYYESVQDIIVGDPTKAATGDIKGSYVAEGSLDVNNEKEKFQFKLKKVKEGTNEQIKGAVFKLTGPDPLQDERYMTTGEDGMITFAGLEAGTYKLEETQPAPGYENASTEWTVRITDEGKVYIKEIKKRAVEETNAAMSVVRAASSSSANRIIQYLANNSSSLYGVDTGLEFGPDMVEAALRAGNDWEEIDPERSEEPDTRANPNNPTKVFTKITKINKDTKRFKQLFLINGNDNQDTKYVMNIHKQPSGNLSPSDLEVRVFYVDIDSTLDNLKNPSADFNLSGTNQGLTEFNEKGQPHKVRLRFSEADGNNRLFPRNRFDKNKLFAIEVISKYTPGTNLGLGLDYYYKRTGKPNEWKKHWGAQSYTSADAINREAYSVSATSQGHGTVKANPSENIAKGTQVTVNVNPDHGYELQSLIVDEQDVTQSVSNNQYTFGMPNHNVNVEASFKEKAPEQATVSFSPGEGSGTMAEQKVNIGSNYKLPANEFDAPSGKEFKAWSVNNEEKNPEDFITVNADTKITALWKDKAPETYNITVNNPQEGGTVTADKTSATAGTEITLTVKPKEGYELQSLTVGDKDVTTSVANNQYKFKMPANNVTISANFKAADMGTEIPEGEAAQITNKQVGIELKVHKRNNVNEGLEGAKFTLKKYKDNTFKEVDETFKTDLTATSDAEGNVVFKDKQNNTVKLNTGYYILEETKSPVGYKKQAAPWKLQVKEENGSLVIVQNGPENTATSFLSSNKAVAADNQKGSIKYKSIVKNIDPDSKTFVQRVYIDTRAYGKVVNVQITPKHKREEIDRPGLPPVTITEGVKTAYRSTYQITNPPENVDVDKVLNRYDLREANVRTVNTARWRPFDWGFDEDLLNLEPGVYYIDIEGYYDGSIVDKKVTNEVAIDSNFNFTKKDGRTPSAEPVLKDSYVRNDIPEKDLGKIDLHIDFYDGAREFQEINDVSNLLYKHFDQGSYQHGATTIKNWMVQRLRQKGYTQKQAEDFANNWAEKKQPGQKYANYISKKVKINDDDRNWIYTGIINPSVTGTPVAEADTSLDISSLYTSDTPETVPQEGMSITNERQVYNITFSKHKMDGDDNTNRLEGAVFKLQKKEGSFWYDMDESYVSSAFNGYFGFRRLEPGAYRLLEVAPPEGYRALDGTLLEFVIKTIDPKGETFKKDGKTYDKESGLEVQIQPDGTNKVVDPETGKIVESANGYVTIEYKRDNYLEPNVKDDETSTGKLVDFVTSATAKNIGKVRNEEPGKGSVTIKKFDEKDNPIPGVRDNKSGELIAGAKFRATRLGADTDDKGNPVADAVYEGYVDENGTLKLEGLPLGNYELREVESPKGYINTGHVWHFTVGGKGYDPYAEDASPRTRNITNLIELTSSDMIVNRPYSGDTTQGEYEIRPHVGQSLQFTNEYKIQDNVKISSGDYFVLKLTDNMDLHGIREDKPTNLDLFADGIGTLAKADYNRQAGTITYTFTKAAEQYTVTDFKNVISAHINLNRVRNTSTQEVGMSVGNDTSEHKNILVNYIVGTEYDNDGYNFINMASKIVSFDSDTGEFVHYFYINREGEYDGKNLTFRYKPNQKVDNLQITTYDLYYTDNNSKIQSMPASFGVNENDRNLWRYGITQPKTVEANKTTTTNIGNYPYNRASIVKVTGKIANTKNLTEYRGNSALYYGYNYTDNYGYQRWAENPSVYRWDGVYVFENESTADAKFELKIPNPSNKVVFEKVNTEGQVLKPTLDEKGNVVKGAKFSLEKNDGTIENPATTWTAKTNPTLVDEDGRISYNHLDKGLYRLIENEVPEGYAKPNGPVAYLKVDDSGKIYQKVTVPNAEGTGTSEIYQEVSETIAVKVVNNKPIEFVKVDAEDNSVKLQNAEFKVLYKEKLDGKYEEYKVDGKVVTAKSDENGKFSLNISKDGYYALKETKAPEGYGKYPGEYIKEFKLENGKVQVLEKDPLKASKTIGANGMITSEILEVDKDKGTFKQRLVINPGHTEWTFDKEDTLLQLDVNNWNVSDNYRTIRVATLEKGKTVADLKDTDFREVNPRNQQYNTNPLIYSIPSLYKADDYTQPNPKIANIVTEKGLVVEITGKITDKSTPVELNPEVYSRAFSRSIDKVSYKLDINNMSDGKGTYVNYDSKDPIQVENHKATFPHTGAMGIIGFLVVGAVIMTTAYYKYRRKRRESALS